jgi:hypothetical protein
LEITCLIATRQCLPLLRKRVASECRVWRPLACWRRTRRKRRTRATHTTHASAAKLRQRIRVYSLDVGSQAQSVLPRASFSLARWCAAMLSEMRLRGDVFTTGVTTWWDGVREGAGLALCTRRKRLACHAHHPCKRGQAAAAHLGLQFASGVAGAKRAFSCAAMHTIRERAHASDPSMRPRKQARTRHTRGKQAQATQVCAHASKRARDAHEASKSVMPRPRCHRGQRHAERWPTPIWAPRLDAGSGALRMLAACTC